MTIPSVRISNEPEEREKERKTKKMPFIVATYVYALKKNQSLDLCNLCERTQIVYSFRDYTIHMKAHFRRVIQSTLL